MFEGAQKAPLGSQFFEQAFSFRLVPPSEYDSVAVLEHENDRGRVGAFVDDLTEIDPVVQDQFRAALIDFATRVYSLRYGKRAVNYSEMLAMEQSTKRRSERASSRR